MSPRLFILAMVLTCGCNLALGTEEGVLTGSGGLGSGGEGAQGGGDRLGGGGAGASGGGGEGGASGCTGPDQCPAVECFTATCNGGSCGADAAVSGTPCGGALDLECDGEGNCVGCLDDGDCATDTPCADYSCDALGTCQVVYQGLSVVSDPTDGDCKAMICTGDSPDPVLGNDDSDVPVDANECTNDLCAAGTPSNPILTGAPCEYGVCNPVGVCACQANFQCSNNDHGDQCIMQKCGCDGGADCDQSAFGNWCFVQLATCGCQEDGDCPGAQTCVDSRCES